jgi:hypothetical protein
MTEVKTTFAAHGNPWAQLIKPETQKPETQKQKMQKQAKQPVKPAAPKAQPVGPKFSAAKTKARIDPDTLEISSMPYPGRGGTPAAKFAVKFASLGVNQRMMCRIEDANSVRKAMEKWAQKNKPGHFVRYITDCGDGMGGVWLLEDEVKK